MEMLKRLTQNNHAILLVIKETTKHYLISGFHKTKGHTWSKLNAKQTHDRVTSAKRETRESPKEKRNPRSPPLGGRGSSPLRWPPPPSPPSLSSFLPLLSSLRFSHSLSVLFPCLLPSLLPPPPFLRSFFLLFLCNPMILPRFGYMVVVLD